MSLLGVAHVCERRNPSSLGQGGHNTMPFIGQFFSSNPYVCYPIAVRRPNTSPLKYQSKLSISSFFLTP